MNPGKVLQQMRKSAGLSQHTIAERLGVSQARVSAIECCGLNLEFSTIRSYLEALGVTGPVVIRDGDKQWILASWPQARAEVSDVV